MAGFLVGLNINDVAAETFSGNASTTAFTLAVAGTTNTCGVYILGVHQVPTTDYSVSGTTLTFTAAPPSGTNNICVVYTKPQTVGAPADGTVTTAKLSGDLTLPGKITAAGDTAAGDNASIGYTSSEGLILTGQGSTNDVTIKNDADADVITIATGTTNVDVVGDLTVGTITADGDTSASDNATIGYTAAEGLILTGQGSTNDITIKNDADADVITIATGGTTAAFAGVVSHADGAVATPSITNTGDLNTGVYFPAADTVGVTAGGTEQFRFGSNPIPGGGNKNLLINGAMNVWQRSTAANTGIGASSGVYVLDRWNHYIDSGPQARVTTTQVASGGDAAAAGFTSAMKVDCTTAEAAVAAGELHGIAQRIEARHVQHLAWGTATAKTLTLSFWMKSPKSGIHCCSLSDVGGRTRNTEFTISSADTWENFSVNFAGDTSGAVFTDVSTSGLMVFFPLVAGSNFENTADTWHATQEHCTSNQQNLLDSTSNDFYLTGVQLEVGSVATDFAHEDYTLTLSKCRRYCFGMTAAASADIALGMGTSTQRAYMFLHVPVEMRGNPALTATAADWDIMDLVNADVAVETLIIHTHYGGTMIYKLRVDQSGGGITTYRPYSLKEGPHAGGKILFLDAEL